MMRTSPEPLIVETQSENQTRRLGLALSPALRSGDVLALSGPLGAGKTIFVQGIARGLGIEDQVTSPAFVLIRSYEGRLPLVHIDVYRLQREQEWIDLAADEIGGGPVTVVEWGNLVAPMLAPHLSISIDYVDDITRAITISPSSQEWSERMETVAMLTGGFEGTARC